MIKYHLFGIQWNLLFLQVGIVRNLYICIDGSYRFLWSYWNLS